MKTVFLLMVVSALLVVSGLGQTPDAGSNTDQATITGCLGGSDGNYTIAEEGSRQILKISTSSVDLKLHLGQDVSLIGHKTSGTASSGSADNSFAVTGLNVISEHCAATAVAPAATADPPVTTGGPSPGVTVSAPATVAAANTPAASTPAAPASPSASASTPGRRCNSTRCDG
jgi:cytoskeletal protein RodZ